MVWGRREEGSGWGTHVYLWRIHFDIWQNQYNIVKLKNNIKKKRSCMVTTSCVLGPRMWTSLGWGHFLPTSLGTYWLWECGRNTIIYHICMFFPLSL